MLAFFIGLFVGSIFGIITMSLLQIGRENDKLNKNDTDSEKGKKGHGLN